MTSATLTRADQLTVTEHTQFTDEQKARLLACSPAERAVLIGEPTDADLEPIFAYIRISDDREGRQAGIERQLLDLISLARRRRARIIAVYADNDIGASDHTRKVRPEYSALMCEVPRSSVRTVAAYTSNRLTRRPTEHEDQIRLSRSTGVEFVYCASPAFDLSTSAGRRVARILAATDAGEAEDISERVIRAKLQSAVDGVYSGGARGFGYRVEYGYAPNGLPIKPGRLVIDEREATLIRDAVKAFLAGETLASIAADWTAVGVPTPQGGARWSPVSVRGILGRGRNAGLSERKGEVMGQGQWPAIISEDELAAVRAKLNDPARKTNHAGYERRWLGSGLYQCGQPGCASKMRSSGRKNGDGGSRYCCRDAGHCVINAREVDAHVRGVVCAHLVRYGASLLSGSQADERARLTEEANVLRGRIDGLAAAFGADDRADARAFAVATRKLEERLAAIEEAQALLIVPANALATIADADDPEAAFSVATLERQRAIVDALFTVTVKPGRRGRQPAGTNLMDRVVMEPREING